MLDGTIGTDPQPIIAQVCTACGFIELFAPIPLANEQRIAESEALIERPALDPALSPMQAAMQTTLNKL
jgi:hypothetical protein